MSKLPLASFGFNWVLPAIIGAVVGYFVKSKEESSSVE